jgi:hypothetical protein
MNRLFINLRCDYVFFFFFLAVDFARITIPPKSRATAIAGKPSHVRFICPAINDNRRAPNNSAPKSRSKAMPIKIAPPLTFFFLEPTGVRI